MMKFCYVPSKTDIIYRIKNPEFPITVGFIGFSQLQNSSGNLDCFMV